LISSRIRSSLGGVVVASAPDRVTVLFDQVGYKTLSLVAVTDQHLLDPPPARAEQGLC
jgi:hypothetical protein